MQPECLSSSVATSGNNIQSRMEISELVTIKVTTSSVLVSSGIQGGPFPLIRYN